MSAMVSNGSMHYDHDMDGTHTSLDGCQAQIRGQTDETFLAIRYERNTLMVRCLLYTMSNCWIAKQLMVRCLLYAMSNCWIAKQLMVRRLLYAMFHCWIAKQLMVRRLLYAMFYCWIAKQLMVRRLLYAMFHCWNYGKWHAYEKKIVELLNS